MQTRKVPHTVFTYKFIFSPPLGGGALIVFISVTIIIYWRLAGIKTFKSFKLEFMIHKYIALNWKIENLKPASQSN